MDLWKCPGQLWAACMVIVRPTPPATPRYRFPEDVKAEIMQLCAEHERIARRDAD